MPAVNHITHFSPPMTSLTDVQLEREHEFWSAELTSAFRWGNSPEVADEMRSRIEAEQRRRRVSEIRAEQLNIRPFVVDHPGARAAALVLDGAGKARLAVRPSRFLMACATAALFVCFLAAAAFAGQRVLELEARYAAGAQV